MKVKNRLLNFSDNIIYQNDDIQCFRFKNKIKLKKKTEEDRGTDGERSDLSP